MPVWSDILADLAQTASPDGAPDFDGVRRKYLAGMHARSGRDVMLYASGWLQKPDVSANLVSIVDEDIEGFMEAADELSGDVLDLILHSPGGSPETAEAIVAYLRSRFRRIRAIVPNLAMSAATMIACAADEIVLGDHSFLGPIDPQIILSTPLGVTAVPAQAVLDRFNQARKEGRDPDKLAAWLPMLAQYGPSLLNRCESVLKMSRNVVKTWLQEYMMKGAADPSGAAESIAGWLAGHRNFGSHNRHICRDDVEKHGLTVARLEDDTQFQNPVLSVFHSTTLTFSNTMAAKITENHLGRSFIKRHPPI